MRGPFRGFVRNQLRIVTFNYDRSLEHYLFQAVRAAYGSPREECARQIGQIPIVHIYGTLGPLSWQQNDQAVDYGRQSLDTRRLIRASMGIKTLHEGQENEAQQNFAQAHEWLKWADRVLFLGFGFHEDNVNRLALVKVLRRDQEVKGTCLGLDRTAKHRAQTCVGSSASEDKEEVRKPIITFPHPNADCHAFLHDHVVLS
jgi:hypothetical protein